MVILVDGALMIGSTTLTVVCEVDAGAADVEKVVDVGVVVVELELELEFKLELDVEVVDVDVDVDIGVDVAFKSPAPAVLGTPVHILPLIVFVGKNADIVT